MLAARSYDLTSLFAILISFLPPLVLSQITIDPSSVTLSLRTTWCLDSQSTCDVLCSYDTYANTCSPTTFAYSCICIIDTIVLDAGLAFYIDTMPTFICETVFANSIAAAVGNASAQASCDSDEKLDCGRLTPVALATASLLTTSTMSVSSTSSSSTNSTSSSFATGSSLITSTSTSTSSSTSVLLSLTSLLPQPSTSTSTTTLPLSSQSSSSSTHVKKTLGTGAKVGIGLGYVLGISFIFARFCVISKHRQSQSRKIEEVMPKLAELSAAGLHQVPELVSEEQRLDLDGKGTIGEVEGGRYEMP